ncbi:hypothetical protein ABZP36_024242 [Zizania latifolia]
MFPAVPGAPAVLVTAPAPRPPPTAPSPTPAQVDRRSPRPAFPDGPSRSTELEAVAVVAGWPVVKEEVRPLKVVFASLARYFTDVAPMVWGGVASEKLQLNRE